MLVLTEIQMGGWIFVREGVKQILDPEGGDGKIFAMPHWQ